MGRSMSVTAYFSYLRDHKATDLAKALGRVVMLRSCGAQPFRVASDRERAAR